jgi:acylpyruvate hydrolase
MKIVVFGDERRVGAWFDECVVDLALADPQLPSTLNRLIVGGRRLMDRVEEVVESARAGRVSKAVQPVESTSLRPPAVYRPRIGCAAGNYAGHIVGSAQRKGIDSTRALDGIAGDSVLPSAETIVRETRARGVPRGFWKDFAMPLGPGDEISYPARAERLDYEGEVVAVIGRTAKDVPVGEGADYIWGVSLLNDWSIRGESSKGSLSFNLNKNFDGGASLGPCVVVDELDPANVHVETRVNGELRQSYNSGDMIFTHAEYIEYLSRDFTLLPGDMISGGSGPGTATDSDGRYLAPGDTVEVSSTGIGVLRNVIVAKRR